MHTIIRLYGEVRPSSAIHHVPSCKTQCSTLMMIPRGMVLKARVRMDIDGEENAACGGTDRQMHRMHRMYTLDMHSMMKRRADGDPIQTATRKPRYTLAALTIRLSFLSFLSSIKDSDSLKTSKTPYTRHRVLSSPYGTWGRVLHRTVQSIRTIISSQLISSSTRDP